GYNQYNKYYQSGYYNRHTVVKPENLSLHKIQWEKTRKINWGFNLGLLDDLLQFELDVYDHRTTDLIMKDMRISSANGFSSLSKVNAGTMRNKGWDLNFHSGWFAKIGKFQMKVRANIAQNFNEVEEMDALLLESLNGSEKYQPTNLNYNQRVQIGNALGSIYGLKYQGVYRYDYDHNGYTRSSWSAYGYAESVPDGNGGYRNSTSFEEAAAAGDGWHYSQSSSGEWYRDYAINTAAAANRRGENNTCPIAYDAAGNMLTDKQGNPLPIYYAYSDNNAKYPFNGGDAIYEDINHDGQIDRYDMVYLGNSNPKCNGGFGFTLKYERLQILTGFNFRIGNDIVNLARMNAESMLKNVNQSYATTWRWRKNGDITTIPRALSDYSFNSFNSLPSDRYVEKGDYLRLQYIQVSYDFDPKKLKKYGIRNLKLFASVNNLWCWTKYTGVDPDVSPRSFGVSSDNNRTPRTRSFTASINLGF
nr:TonB-dependent receptor [Bacteroidaceae bacterium]